MEENNVELRNATAEETESLKSWADKKCKQTRKGVLFILILFLAAYIFLLIVNAIYIHSLIIMGFTIFLIVYMTLFCAALYLFFAPSLGKNIESGAFKVQRGRITDRCEDKNTEGKTPCTVVFVSDKGSSASINIYPNLYKYVKTGSCLILRWDDPKKQKYYRVIMSDELKLN